MVRACSTLLVLAVACMVGLATISARGDDKKDGGKKPATTHELFKKLDKNKDGKISKEEFTAGRKDLNKAKSQFDKADKNRDGYLGLDEFKFYLKRTADRAAKKVGEKNPENESEKKAINKW